MILKQPTSRSARKSQRQQGVPDFDLGAARPAPMAAVEACRFANGDVVSRLHDERDILTAVDDFCSDAQGRVLYVTVEDVTAYSADRDRWFRGL